MVAITESKAGLSLEEFLKLPETKPAQEYINGEIYQKPMPQGEHSRIQTKLATAINQIAKSQKLAYAFPELSCTFEGVSLVPDIAVFEWSRIPRQANGKIENKFNFAPDWIIEILSPEQSYSRLMEKIIFCLNHGTKLGWLVDSQEEAVTIFQPNQTPQVLSDDEILPALDIIPDWQLSVKECFAWLYLN